MTEEAYAAGRLPSLKKSFHFLNLSDVDIGIALKANAGMIPKMAG
jgi:hypothetical protein